MVEQFFNAKTHPDEKTIKPFLEKFIAANNYLSNISKENESYKIKVKETYELLRQQQILEKFNHTLLTSITHSDSVRPYTSNGITTVENFLAWKPKKRSTVNSLRYGQVLVAIDKLKEKLQKTEVVSIDVHSTDTLTCSLVQQLSILISTRTTVDEAQKLYSQHHDALSAMVSGAKQLFTGMPWLLKRPSKKEEIWQAILALQEFEDKTSFLELAGALQNKYVSTIKGIESNASILTEFAKNTAPYYALLDNLIERNHAPQEELGFDVDDDDDIDDEVESSAPEEVQEEIISNDFPKEEATSDAWQPSLISAALGEVTDEDIPSENKVEMAKDECSIPHTNEKNNSPFVHGIYRSSSVNHSEKKQPEQPQEKPKEVQPSIAPSYLAPESWEERELKELKHNAKELSGKVRNVPLNTSKLTANLRPYQEFAAKYILLQKKVLLGDEMGLGKTVEAIAVMAHLAATFKEKLYFLVICPLSILENWGREVRKHSLLKPYQIYGKEANAVLNLWKKNGGVGITTYEVIQRIDVSNIDISLLVVDEAHYIKNPESNRTRRVLKVQELIPRVVYMTGTPLENRLKEMTFLLSNLQHDFYIPQYWYKELPDEQRFRLKVIPVYLRRVRNDVLKELKEKVEIEDWGAMNSVELQHYYHALQYESYMAIRRHSWSLPNPKKDSYKAQKLLEICDDAKENGRKVLVFTYFKDTLQKVQSLLGTRCYGPIDGSVPGPERQGIIDRFSDGPVGSVLACQITSGGMGLNIQAASVVIICEPQLKPSTENQAISRAYRVGQAENVFVHRLLLSDTIDEHLMGILQGKMNLFNRYADKSLMGVESLKDKQIMGAVLQEELKRHNLKRSEMAES